MRAAGGPRFGDVVEGAKLAKLRPESNAYICNNLAYVVNYLMESPNHGATLLESSTEQGRGLNVRLRADHARTLGFSFTGPTGLPATSSSRPLSSCEP